MATINFRYKGYRIVNAMAETAVLEIREVTTEGDKVKHSIAYEGDHTDVEHCRGHRRHGEVPVRIQNAGAEGRKSDKEYVRE